MKKTGGQATSLGEEKPEEELMGKCCCFHAYYEPWR